MLSAASPVPLYRQLAEQLLAEIRGGGYANGTAIPSEHALAARFGIGRPTVRQATDLLVRKGVLERRRGAGTFVARHPDEVDLFSLAGTLEAFRRSGIALKTKLVEPLREQAVPEQARTRLAGGAAYHVQRLSSVRGVPLLLEDLYLDAEVFPRLERFNLANRSVSQLVEEHYFLKPLGGRQSFRVGTLPERRARLLGATVRTPLLLVERSLDFSGAKDALYAAMACRTDAFAFAQTLGAPA